MFVSWEWPRGHEGSCLYECAKVGAFCSIYAPNGDVLKGIWLSPRSEQSSLDPAATHMHVPLHACGSENVAVAFCTCVSAPLRAATAYLRKPLAGLGCRSMENLPKPLVGVNTLRTFHAPTSQCWDRISSKGLLHNLHNKMGCFDQILQAFIHRCARVEEICH